MANLVCWVYSEQELTPRAIEVIRDIKSENGYGDVKFLDVNIHGTPGPGSKVLVFGRIPDGVWDGIEFIQTYSIAQIMSKANAATVLVASLQLYFQGVHQVPSGLRPWCYTSSSSTPKLIGFDYDKPTAIDIETDGNLGVTHTPEEVNIISVALYQEGMAPTVYAISEPGNGGTSPLHPRMLEMLAEELPKFTKPIYHNGKFDTRVLNRILGVKLCVWFDTMLAHHVLNHAAGMHGLKELAQRYLGAPEWEADLKKYTKGGGHYELIPRGKLVEYNGWDVYWTFQLYKLFAPHIELDEDNEKAFLFEMSVADMLLDVEMNGIPFSFDESNKLISANSIELGKLLGTLRFLSGKHDFNPNSPKQVKDILNDRFKVAVSSTNEATLTEIVQEHGELSSVGHWCGYLLEYRGLAKQTSTYAEGWAKHARKLPGDRQARVRPTFLVHGTSTGRLSSTAPNAQNVPREKKVRKIVTIEE